MASPADQIARINLLSATARTSWLALLAFLAYIGITLLAVQDIDFFVASRQTQLPLVGISIPTFSFFIFAPPLAAALYVYLHIHLLKLWDALAEAPYVVDGAPLGESLHPWIANDFALDLKGFGALRPRPLRQIGAIATFALVWAAAPLIIFGFWLRSPPAHEPLLTLGIALSFLIAAYAGAASLRAARQRLRFGPTYPTNRRWPWWQMSLASLFCVLLLAVSWFRTGTGLDTYAARAIDAYEAAFGTSLSRDPTRLIPPSMRLAAANLVEVEIVDLPPDWRPLETARMAYRETWCRREGLALDVCGHFAEGGTPPSIPLAASRKAWCDKHALNAQDACATHFTELDARFRDAWAGERRATRENLPGRYHRNIDLRRADAQSVSLVGADLRGAQMEAANFTGALLEGVDLERAQMQRTLLFLSSMKHARLSMVQLVEAVLLGAEMEGVNLTDAQMEGAVLTGARMVRADFSRAQMIGVDLSLADLRSAIWAEAHLRALALSADFRGADSLTQDQLDGVVGNDNTLVPAGINERGELFHVWTCWDTPPRGSVELVRTTGGDFEVGYERIDFRLEFLCSPENPRRKTGTPLALDAPYPPAHPLGGRD